MRHLACVIAAVAVMASCAYEDDELLDDEVVVEEEGAPLETAPDAMRVLEEGGIQAPAQPNALICSATLRSVSGGGACRPAGALYDSARSICQSTGWPVVSGSFSGYCGTVYGVDYYRRLGFQCCVWN